MDKSTLYMKDHLVGLIEAKVNWGKGSTWNNKDFEELSKLIFQSTNKRLSVTTLKRIWGRVEWVANPSMATLDILSEFVGFKNWRAFVQANQNELPEPKALRNSKKTKIWILAIALALLGSFFGFFWEAKSNEQKKSTIYRPEDFSFASRPVSKGIPNSVVFEYDATAAEQDSKIEIQQDWDRNKRTTINKNDSIATSIYYHPGFFKSKLVIDSNIIRESDVFIPTDDWLGIIEQEPHPIYLHKSDISKEGKISITREIIASHNLDPRTSKVTVSFYQVKDFGELYIDDFQMSTIIKNEFEEGVSACQTTQVFILYDGGAIGIPLSKKGCASDLKLMTFENLVDGKNNDLSGFGVDFSEFVELKCVSKNNKLDIIINGRSIYQMEVPESPLKIKGITIHFEGAGSIKEVEFKKKDEIIYGDYFLK